MVSIKLLGGKFNGKVIDLPISPSLMNYITEYIIENDSPSNVKFNKNYRRQFIKINSIRYVKTDYLTTNDLKIFVYENMNKLKSKTYKKLANL